MYKYADFRKAGYRAAESLRSAKIVAEFSRFEDDSLRIVAKPEYDSYFDVYGEPEGYTDEFGRRITAEQEREQIAEQIERDGCWIVSCEMLGDDGDWHVVDSVGMNVGYSDPCDALQNCYVPGHRVIIGFDSSLSSERAHAKAAKALCRKMNWHGRMIGGHTRRGMVFVFVDSLSPSFTIPKSKRSA